MRYDIAFLKGDHAGMERLAADGRARSEAEETMSYHEGSVLAYAGRWQQSKGKSRRAVELAQQTAGRERAALYESASALRAALFGNAPEARRSATAALDLSKARDVEYGAAFALALSGDSSRSETLASDLERRFPEDTSVRFDYVPVVRALLALNRGEPATAIDLLEAAVPLELGDPQSSFTGSFGTFYSIYVRGAGGTWPHGKAWKPPSNFKRFSLTLASSSAIPWARWRGSNWAERWLCREMSARQGRLSRTS